MGTSPGTLRKISTICAERLPGACFNHALVLANANRTDVAGAMSVTAGTTQLTNHGQPARVRRDDGLVRQSTATSPAPFTWSGMAVMQHPLREALSSRSLLLRYRLFQRHYVAPGSSIARFRP